MRMYDLIMKKRNGGSLSREETDYMIREYVAGNIPDYQMSAFLMAVYFRGMTKEETLAMTQAVTNSGETIDLSEIKGKKIDKHSTGGVGDKTTMIIAPIVAACGVKVAKMSGRGLGHTGGTIDKLESIPGFKTTLSRERFFEVVNEVGFSVVGQSGNLTPADKKLYALRDVTATVDSIPLIAVSIMGKKLAAGNDGILLDVKTGSGAFMKTVEDSVLLAQEMVSIGENAGKNTVALITNMDIPLGNAIGNSLEVIEAVKTLNGEGPKDLTEVSLNLAANMLYLAEKGTIEQCKEMALAVIKNKEALKRFAKMVEAQEGDPLVILNTDLFKKAKYEHEVLAEKTGYIEKMNTEGCGIASMMLGAGRETKDSQIDYSAGIILKKKTGEWVRKGDKIAILYASDQTLFNQAEERLKESIQISRECPQKQPLIYARVTGSKVEYNK